MLRKLWKLWKLWKLRKLRKLRKLWTIRTIPTIRPLNPNPMQTAALFDLDGVLVDTESQYTQFWATIAQRDFPNDPDFAIRIKGHTLTQIYAAYYPERPERQAEIAAELVHFEQRMSYPLIEGALNFVAQLRAQGIPTAIVTSSNHDKMQCLLQAHPDFPQLFDRIFTAEDALRSKPAPDCYLNAARHFGLEASSCFVFEDSLNGLRAAQASQATVIGLTTSHPAAVIAPYCCYTMPHFGSFTVGHMLNLQATDKN